MAGTGYGGSILRDFRMRITIVKQQSTGRRRSAMRRMSVLAAALAMAAAAPAFAADKGGVKIGTLSCHEASGWGFVFGSSRAVRCVYDGNHHVEHYRGDIAKFGVDIGYQKSGVLLWTVVAPGPDVGHGALAGHYGGLTAGASAVVGAAANGLIGGSHKNITLQPISVEGTTGLNVAAGVADLTLHYEPGA